MALVRVRGVFRGALGVQIDLLVTRFTELLVEVGFLDDFVVVEVFLRVQKVSQVVGIASVKSHDFPVVFEDIFEESHDRRVIQQGVCLGLEIVVERIGKRGLIFSRRPRRKRPSLVISFESVVLVVLRVWDFPKRDLGFHGQPRLSGRELRGPLDGRVLNDGLHDVVYGEVRVIVETVSRSDCRLGPFLGLEDAALLELPLGLTQADLALDFAGTLRKNLFGILNGQFLLRGASISVDEALGVGVLVVAGNRVGPNVVVLRLEVGDFLLEPVDKF